MCWIFSIVLKTFALVKIFCTTLKIFSTVMKVLCKVKNIFSTVLEIFCTVLDEVRIACGQDGERGREGGYKVESN